LACGTGMHRIDRPARIHDNRRGLSGFAAGVVRVTTGVLGGWYQVTGSQDQGRARSVPRRRPAQMLTGSPACGLAALNPWADPELAGFAQVKART
jgi:hypothetical protein